MGFPGPPLSKFRTGFLPVRPGRRNTAKRARQPIVWQPRPPGGGPPGGLGNHLDNDPGNSVPLKREAQPPVAQDWCSTATSTNFTRFLRAIDIDCTCPCTCTSIQ